MPLIGVSRILGLFEFKKKYCWWGVTLSFVLFTKEENYQKVKELENNFYPNSECRFYKTCIWFKLPFQQP